MAEAIKWTPKQWERKVQGFLRIAETTYGNAPDPTPADLKAGRTPAAPDAGFWRDLDRSNPQENSRRMPGHLDFLYWRVYKLEPLPPVFTDVLPAWKMFGMRRAIEANGEASFDLYFECKTGRGKPNKEQLRTIRRINLNPGAHAFVVYPPDREWIRKALGI